MRAHVAVTFVTALCLTDVYIRRFIFLAHHYANLLLTPNTKIAICDGKTAIDQSLLSLA
jgi:hypothetical protein